ncbi:hypothetical protein KJ684_02085 [Patescibacteria group bacterium]|nr:hypothetical protein [Patescibacteria group bacterium]
MILIFKVGKAGDSGRSSVELILGKEKKIAEDSDKILSTLDFLLKKNRIKLESVNDIKLEINKQAGLTSQRIVKSIIKALSFNL